MKKFKKIVAATIAACMGLLPLTACKDDDGVKKLQINEVTHSVFYAPLYLADALGYFQEENIEIELTNGGGADNVMSSLLAGEADIGFCGPEAALYVLIGGSSDVPTVFGQLTKRDGSFLVAREKPTKPFQWSDLQGKEVLAGRQGGVPAMTFEYVLKERGVSANLNYGVAFNMMTSAFEAGTGDYCTMFDPVAYEYEAAGKGYVVASVGEASGEVPYTCFMAKNSWLNKNKDTAEGFLRAVTKAVKYVNENTPETVAPYLTPYFDGTSEASLAASVKRYRDIDAWRTNLTMTEESFNRLQDIIESAGELEQRAQMSKLVDNSYANTVYNEIYAK
ncbi:MAG: ABC transporter substrate-binding protein [Clostridiales bacterium]|nr:ABC transporter substrate-binding protein [Clostridiales bacterium]